MRKDQGYTIRTPKLRKNCQVPGCTRAATARLRTRWRCAEHIRASKAAVR